MNFILQLLHFQFILIKKACPFKQFPIQSLFLHTSFNPKITIYIIYHYKTSLQILFHISKFPSLTESTLELNKAISNGHHPCRFTFDHRIKETRKISHPLRFPLRISHTYEIRKKSARMEVYTAACPTRVFIHLAEERSFYRCLRERFAARQRAANRFVGQHTWAGARRKREESHSVAWNEKFEIRAEGRPREISPPLPARPSKSRRDVALPPLHCHQASCLYRLISGRTVWKLYSQTEWRRLRWCFKVFKRLLAPFVSSRILVDEGMGKRNGVRGGWKVRRCFEILSDWWMRLLRGEGRGKRKPLRLGNHRRDLSFRTFTPPSRVSHFLGIFNSSSRGWLSATRLQKLAKHAYLEPARNNNSNARDSNVYYLRGE